MFHIKKNSLKNFFDEKTASAGLRVIHNVQSWQVLQESSTLLILKGFTESEQTHDMYSQKVKIVKNNSNITELVTTCSCPVGERCKHSYALILKFIAKRGEIYSDPFAIDRWIGRFKQSSESIEKKESVDNYFIYYQIEKSKEKFYIKLMKRKFLKKGGLGKESPFGFSLSREVPQYLSEFDLSILTELSSNNLNRYQYSKEFPIQGALSISILKRLIEKKKLFLENSRTVSFGEEKRGFLSWKNVNNFFSLTIQFEDEDIELIPDLSENLYINLKTAEIGEIIGVSFKGEELQDILYKEIYLDEENFQDVKKELEKIKYLPPLVDKEIKHSKPKPYLHIRENDVMLNFDYNGLKINSDNKNEFLEGQDEILYRDLETEKQLIEDLKKFNLTPNSEMVFENSNDIEKVRHFFESGISELKDDGWKVRVDEKGKIDFKDIESEDIDFEIENESTSSWFSMDFFIDIDGQKLKLAPIIESFFSKIKDGETSFLPDKINVPIDDKNFIRMDREKVQPIINTVLKLYNKDKEDIEVSNHELHDLELTAELEKRLQERHYDLFKLKERLKEFKRIDLIHQPKGLNAELREYQREGLSWLNFLREYKFGGILADDMGLGKTIQTLGFLLNEKESGRGEKTNLIVVPTSLLGNWKRENEKFTPSLTLEILHQKDRKNIYKEIIEGSKRFDILVTTYNLISRDLNELTKIDFNFIILDEAQKIKNPKAKVSRNLRLLKSENRICLTGTPMENHLGELWSLFDFLMPNFLFKEDIFNKFFKNPIEKDRDLDALKNLKNRIKPFILRREKREVARELPPKTEIIQRVTFDSKQTKLYESIRVTMEEKVQKAIRENGLAKSQIEILDALLKLRQVCCDPRLLKIDESEKIKESAKLDALLELLEELLMENRKVILFSQFTSMLSLIEDELIKKRVDYSKLTGSTRDRDREIELFKSGKVDIFLVSLKAGGVGLNLTEADTIIIYDPWWNPAVENQAIDRAYRIGQDKKVFVYRFIIEKSVEEKILELQEKKSNLSKSILEDGTESFKITQEDIAELFAPLHGG